MSNQWKAGNYRNSGLSKSAYLSKQSKPKTTYKSPSRSFTPSGNTYKLNDGTVAEVTPTYTNGYSSRAAANPYDAYNIQSQWNNVPLRSSVASQLQNQNPTVAKSGHKTEGSHKSSSPKPKPVNTSQRSSAANVFNKVFGINTANAQEPGRLVTPTTHDTNWTGKITSAIGQAALGVPGAIYKGVTGHNVDLGLTELLGLSKETPNLTYNLGDTPVETVLNGQNISVAPSDPNSLYYSQPKTTTDVLNQGRGPVNYPGVTDRNTYNRTPQPVSNPYTAPQSSQISSAYNVPNPYQPDYTPVQNNPGTVQRPVGMGQFSRGQYANGAGGYGFQGSLGNNGVTDQSSPMNDLLTTLGILPQTAQAAEPNLMSNPYAEVPQTISGGQGTGDFTKPIRDIWNAFSPYMKNNDTTPPTPQTQNPGGSQIGGVAQQFAQGATGGSQQFDSSGYKAAQKAQKKALDELIKSIKAQYAQSKVEGTNALEKSKQEDLLKLSGLFNFANQDPNSEQRIQYEQRSRNDYAGQLSDFLNKLAQGQAKDISSAKQNYNNSLADIMANIQKQQADYENMMWDRQYKMAALNRRGGGGTLKNGSYSIIPGANGSQQYVYNNGRSLQPITADQYMAGKYGVGIMGNTTPMNPSEMSDEQLNAIINGTF